MARKELGHIELQWTCPNCGGINPGPDKVCNTCGAPQPEDVQFEQPERQELITDKEVETKAEAGADIHCPFCGTRNPAGAKICSQCGGDLVEGRKRETGHVVGAYQTGPAAMVRCPHCNAENPDTAKVCSQCGGSMWREEDIETAEPAAEPSRPKTRTGVPIVAILVLVLLCGALAVFAFFAMRTEEVTGTVEGVSWKRAIPVEAIVPVSYSDWQDQIPMDAEIESCREDIRYVQDEPAPNSVEVCGTPYNVDTGSGYAQVVQDCEYHVYDDYCTFSVEEWRQVDVVVLTGENYAPEWPDRVLETGQRLGASRDETYVIFFDAGSEDYSYTTSDYNLYQSAQPGTRWGLNVNSFGSVVSIEQ